jgi:hypothetical protein
MRSLRELLTSHRIPGIRLAEVRGTCAAVAAGLTSYAVTAKQVRYKDGTVFFTVPSVVKTELLLRENDFKLTLGALGISVLAVK